MNGCRIPPRSVIAVLYRVDELLRGDALRVLRLDPVSNLSADLNK